MGFSLLMGSAARKRYGFQSLTLAFGVFSLTLSSLPLSPAFATEEAQFDPGVDGAPPDKMYDKSIAEPDEHFVLLRGWDDKKKEELPEVLGGSPEKPDAPAAPNAMPKKDEPVPGSRDAVIAIYGDPSAPSPITAEDNAPKPFKAIHAAFEAGDEELAFQYARKHVRYLQKFQGRMDNLMAIIGKAMEVEGMSDGEGWTNSPEYQKYNKYVDAIIKEEREKQQELEQDIFSSVLPEDLKKIANSPAAKAPPAELQLEGFHREKMRAHLRTVAPVSSDGRVNLTLIVQLEGHKGSKVMAREMKEIVNAAAKNPKLSFELKTVGYKHKDKKNYFRLKTGLVRAQFGDDLPEGDVPEMLPQLRIEVPSLKKEFVVNGVRRSYFLEELVKIIHGDELDSLNEGNL